MTCFRLSGRCRSVVLAVALALAVGPPAPGMPPPFDQPERVELALVRYFSTGDFFATYREGAESQVGIIHLPRAAGDDAGCGAQSGRHHRSC